MPICEWDDVELFKDGATQGRGKLVIADDQLRWGNDLALDYPSIVLHAVCTDPETFPQPCIYCQVEDSGDESNMEELRFVPKDPNQVQVIFSEMSRCAALHPDVGGDDEGDEDGYDGAEFIDANTSAEKLQMFERAFIEPSGPPPPAPGQFDEVEDENDDE